MRDGWGAGHIENLQRIAVLAERLKLTGKTEKIAGIHDRTPMQSMNHTHRNPVGFTGTQLSGNVKPLHLTRVY